MAYRYEFDQTPVGDRWWEYAEYQLLHKGYEALRSALEAWNQKAKAAGAREGPYEREQQDLEGMIRWGNRELAKAERQRSPVLVNGVSVGTLRYAKAGLVLLAKQLREAVAARRREGWPEAAALSAVPDLPAVEKLTAKIKEDPAEAFWEMLGRAGADEVGTQEWDVFLSHAHEDKLDIAEPLAKMLQARGLRVWYDDFSLQLGMSLRRSIDHGLSNSRFGVVILSPDFLRKQWPQKELDGLAALETDGRNRILPVWHRLGADEVRGYSPTLADRVGISSDRGLEAVADGICAVSRK